MACIQNLRNLSAGTHLYLADYDDTLMPVNFEPANEGNSRSDRTWVQILLPYVNSFGVFRCPADKSPRPTTESTFDQDLIPGDTDSQFYSASLRSNYGYNYQYLAPIYSVGDNWIANPRTESNVTDTSKTLLFVDSVWSHTGKGDPIGGGNWLVVPPCRYYAHSDIDSFTGLRRDTRVVFTNAYGWNLKGKDGGETFDPNEVVSPKVDPALYGNAWPWHNGRLNVCMVDGSVHSLALPQLTNGCDVQNAWEGRITDPMAYLWDTN